VNRRLVLAASAGALVLLVAAVWWTQRAHDADAHSQHANVAPGGRSEPRVLYWYDPMKPDVHFDAPGRSPFMDMDLVPKYADGTAAAGVGIDPRMAQNLGVRTAPVVRGTFWQRVDTTGRVEIDERTLVAVTVRAEAWVERLHVRAEGEFVAEGEALATLYSPTMATAEREYALARSSGDAALVDAGRSQLAALGADRDRIDALAQGAPADARFVLRAPKAGYVMRLGVREGDAVVPDSPLLEIVSHDPIWVLAAVPEVQSSWISRGKSVEVRVPAHPGRIFEGTVDYLYPELDEATRTQRVRVVLPNPDDDLHPGMYADVAIFGGARRDVLLVPSEAVIHTGERTVVVVAESQGRYRPVPVRVGAERDGQTVVLDGVEEGQSVVTSGQFLIDSEASLRGAFERMAPVHAHGDGP
jgi:Cu(I)/Ag(I) efflux system membrane fusion protein